MPGWKKPGESKILGTSYPRLDGPDKATGHAKYAYDINLPGLLYGRVFRSPHAAAVIKSIDVSAAQKMPGVRAVMVTAAVGDTMRYQGQPIGALCATSYDIAEDAIRAIKVTYDVLPHAVQERHALKPNAPRVRGAGMNNVERMESKTQGDVDAAFKAAAVVSEGEYGCVVRTHASLETHGVTCRWDDNTHMTCWASTQHVVGVRDEFAEHFKLPPENIHVITEVMGGGFGSKFGMDYEGMVCGTLAKQAGAPVKLLLTRREEQLAVGNAPSAFGKIRIGADRDGTIVAFDAHIYRSGGVARENGPMPYIYRVGASRVVQDAVYTNTGPSRAWRAPNHPQSSWLMESAVEDLAVKLGMDPLVFRLKNDPNTLRQAEWRLGAKEIEWDRRNARPGSGKLAGTGRYRRGLGCGAATWGGGGVGGSICRVTIMPEGSVLAEIGVQDIGTGTRTYVGSIVAEELALPREAVQVGIGHSTMPPGQFSGGSVTTPSTAPAVKRAAEAARAALLEAAAGKLGAKADDLDMVDARVVVSGDHNRGMSFKEACALLPSEGIKVEGKWDPALQQTSGVAGCQFAEVEVDTLTGLVKPVRVVAVQDGGIIMNKLTFESQLNGGIIQGIGMALYEDRRVCELTGRMVNADMEHYKLPGAREMPAFTPIVYEYPEAKGVSGIGEPPVIPTAAAIRNAILNATGAYLYEAPMTPAAVLTALAAAKRGARA